MQRYVITLDGIYLGSFKAYSKEDALEKAPNIFSENISDLDMDGKPSLEANLH